MSEKTFPTSIRLDPELKSVLEEYAKSERRSLNNYIVGVLMEHVSKRQESDKQK